MTPVLEAEEPSTLSLNAYGKARSTIQGSPLSSRRTKEDRRLLASVQVSGAWHDLSSGQSTAEGTAET